MIIHMMIISRKLLVPSLCLLILVPIEEIDNSFTEIHSETPQLKFCEF